MTRNIGLLWRQYRPGRFERPLSSLEKVNLLIRTIPGALDRDNWSTTSVIKLKFNGELSQTSSAERAVQTAWKALRFRHPEIAAFPENGRYVYEVPNTNSLEKWLKDTCTIVESSVSLETIRERLPRSELAKLYFFPHTSEIMIHSGHFRLDRNAVVCMNFIAQNIANPVPVTFGDEGKNLAPTIEYVLDIPTTEFTPDIEEAAMQRLMAQQNPHPPLTMTPTASGSVPGATRRCMITLSDEETKTLTARCKEKELSVTTAQHAALIEAVAKRKTIAEPRSYMAVCSFDLRSCVKNQDGDEQAAIYAPTICASGVGLQVEVTPSTGFSDYAARLRPVYAAGYGPYVKSTASYLDKLCAIIGSSFSSDAPVVSSSIDAATDKKEVETQGQTEPTLSTLGLLDAMLAKDAGSNGTVQIEDFWLGVDALTKGKIIHTWTWNGKMTFSISYNESFWDDQFVEQFLQDFKNTLLGNIA